MQHQRTAGLLAGLLCLALAAPAAAAPSNVTVRIEGAGATLREEAAVRTTTAPVTKDGSNTCTGTSAAGALEQATSGDWDGPWYGSEVGYGVERIFAESYPFDPDGPGYGWAFWVNDRAAELGVCGIELQDGDEVLFFVSQCRFDPDTNACSNKPVQPLELTLPSSATAGQPVAATVVAHDGAGGYGPVDGARIKGDGIDAGTDAGRGTIVFPQPGTYRLKAERAGSARSAAETVTVVAAGQAPPPVAEADKVPPVGRITGIRNGKRYSRKKAPRTLRGRVAPDPSGLRAVKLSLTRSHRGRCQLYSPSRERFRNAKCGKRVNFSIGDRQDWSYLLPKRLGRGRYVLDVIAVDKLGNRDRLARGRNRVVFFVR